MVGILKFRQSIVPKHGSSTISSGLSVQFISINKYLPSKRLIAARFLRSIYRTFFTLTLVVFSSIAAFSQIYSNEWIDFNQSYFKIKTAEDGMYRITYDNLVEAGFPVGLVDARKIQIFHRGKEQAIHVQGQEDARINPTDFIDFYGKRNDGTSDTPLYITPEAQPHTYYNLYSDTTAYFLTWKLNNETGKRISTFTEANVGGMAPEAYHLAEIIRLFTTDYSAGASYPEGTSQDNLISEFDRGEGWTGQRIRKGQSADFTLSGVDNRYTAGPLPKLEVLLAGRNSRPHQVSVQVGASLATLRTLKDVQFDYNRNLLVTESLLWSDISPSGGLSVRVLVNGFNNEDADFVSVSLIKLTFPQAYNAQGGRAIFQLPPKAAGKSFIQVANVPIGSTLYDISDTDNLVFIGTSVAGANTTAIVPNTTSGRKLLLTNQTLSSKPERTRFRKITPANHDYLIVTHQKLQRAVGPVADAVKEYGAYRASAAGGGYDTLIVNMQQLYNQFYYGEVSPVSIVKFVEFMSGTGDPAFLFLVGKSLSVNLSPHRLPAATQEFQDLVPTYGYPGSDVRYSSFLSPDGLTPAIPTGRLTARSAVEVVAYLNKVKEMEAKPFDDLTRKKLVHLSGGVTLNELSLFKRYVKDFEAVAEGHFLGGKVTTQSKSSNNSVELLNISDIVNEGVGLITFFGHSSPTIIDIEIGFVSNDAQGYRNKGKYPMILVNGCNAGNIFSNTYTFGEDWILTADRGALAFLAHSNLGYVGPLKRYSDIFYATAYADSSYIYRSIGEIHKEVARRFTAISTDIAVNIAQVQQLILQGDPAAKLFGADRPDYAIEDKNLFIQSFDASQVTAIADSFAIGVVVKNFGRTTKDSLSIQVKRTLSNGNIVVYAPQMFLPVLYQDTLYYKIRSRDPGTFGNNRFEVTVDANNRFAELSETNNQASLQYFIPLSGISNLLPANFSIINTSTVKLLSQSTNILTREREYIFELDTAYNFTSPVKMQNNVVAKALASWAVNLVSYGKDTLVYYWRTKFAEPAVGEDTTWNLYSFVYIPGSPEGWAQADFPQFLSNEGSGLDKRMPERQFSFKEPRNKVMVKTFGSQDPANDFSNVELSINGVPYIYDSRYCGSNSINAVAFQRSSAVAYAVLNNRNCGRLPSVINSFTQNDIESASRLLDTYVQTVPTGDIVLLFSIGNVTYTSWPADLKQELLNIGASETVINSLKNGEPFILLGQKGGAPGSAVMVVADPTSTISTLAQQVSLDEIVTGRFTSGTVLSPKIGPASAWSGFYQSHLILGTGNIAFDIVGLDFNNTQTLLFTDVNASDLNLESIDARQYPYLRLQAKLNDTQNANAPQLQHWQVTYTGVPEGIIRLKNVLAEEIEVLQKTEGEEFTLDFVFENISERDFKDSIKVEYTIFNQEKKQADVKVFNIKPLTAGELAEFSILIETENRKGLNNLNVFVNPNVQPEQYYNNNVIDLINFFEVKSDDRNPVLDVAFDGVYIMDGDIVSPSPLIRVVVKDENKFILKKDTTNVAIFLKKPCENCSFERIDFSDARVNWSPATENTDFMVEYQPDNLPDGIYTLRVQAADASGNKAGFQPYAINFEVINASQVTHFYPYPNPFSTSTRFVFTLTGSVIPDQLKIQIMTVTGKVVKEITQNELGPIRIGNNISEYAWDGKDAYGDQLANGVYLYRVIILNGGNTFERRETAADKAFTKGFGKLYLLR